MSNLQRLQFTGTYDDDGNPETVDPDAPRIETRDAFIARRENGATYGATINANEHNLRLQVGAQAAEDARNDESQAQVDSFMEELDRLHSVASAGRAIDARTIENLQHKLNDTAIAYVRMGGDVNDDTMVTLRQRVDAISANARLNK